MSEVQKLDVSKLITLRSEKKEEDANMNIGVFMGVASIAIFQGMGKPKVRIPLPSPYIWRLYADGFQKLQKNTSQDFRHSIGISTYDVNTKTREEVATVVFFRDDKGVPMLGISAAALSTKLKFPIRLPLTQTVANATQDEQSDIALSAMTDVFLRDIPAAVIATSFERPKGGYGNKNSGRPGAGAGAKENSPPDDEIPF